MAAGKELTPSEYIQHHLTFFEKPIGDGGFWTINVDSVATAVLLGVVGLGFIWWVVRGATAGVPNKRQAFVELLIEFIDDQVKGIFHGERHKFVAPAAFTVFFWVLLMNAMDFLPVDIIAQGTHHISEHGFRIVPTADVNKVIAKAMEVRGPRLAKGRYPKVFYGTQVGVNPPWFVLFVNEPAAFKDDFRRFLENKIRGAFGFGEVPVRISFRKRESLRQP